MPLKISSEVTSMHGHIDCIAFNNQQTVLIYVNNKIVNSLVYRGGRIDFENSEKVVLLTLKLSCQRLIPHMLLGNQMIDEFLG